MKIKLILQRTGTDQYSAWNEFKEIPVEIPLNEKWGWEVVGAIWEEDAQNIRVEECWWQPEEQEGGGDECT